MPRAKKTKIEAEPTEVIAYCLPITLDDPPRHPAYWADVKLGYRLLLGVVCAPLFLLGMGVSIYRNLIDKVRENEEDL